MIKLLEFGMRNSGSRNPIMRIIAKICLCVTKKWADRVEKRVNQKWKEIPMWTTERSERIKKQILNAAQMHSNSEDDKQKKK